MYQTVQLSSCVSVQGDLVERLPNGDAVVRDGRNVYRGRPVLPITAAERAERNLRPARRADEA